MARTSASAGHLLTEATRKTMTAAFVPRPIRDSAQLSDIPCTVLIFRASQMTLRRQVWPPCRSRITCKRYPAPPRGATLERRGALTQTSRLLLWLRPIRFFFSVCAVTNFAPISSPLTQASSQRRYVRPVDDSRRKNSLSFKPSIESRMLSLAPVSDTSCIMQSRRQVPSIAMIETSITFSKTTLTPLRRSEVATLCTHLNCSRKLYQTA